MDIQNVNIVRVNADHGRDFHPLADHVTTLQNYTKGEIREFSAFPFSLHLVFDQTLKLLPQMVQPLANPVRLCPDV